MTRIIRPLRGGQITIPSEFRKRLGITEDSILQLTVEGTELRLKALRLKETAEGSPWFKDLYELFAPVRKEAAQFEEKEIDTAVDDAVRAVRAKHA